MARTIKVIGDASKIPSLNGRTREILPAEIVELERRVRSTPQHASGSFGARVLDRQRDLVEMIRNGLPPLESLPASDGLLLRGKRHYCPAPAKTGKSITWLVHTVDMCLAGANVATFDRENGGDEYARRLAAIMEARGLSEKERGRVDERFAYFEYPTLHKGDADLLADMVLASNLDLVIFDSQRMFLSDLGMKEKESDDYADFMAYVIDPLHRARCATLILDNTGHKETTRGRGTAAKGDLNEVIFEMSGDQFGPSREGTVRLKVGRSRFGNYGAWSMKLGGGTFGSWEAAHADAVRADYRTAVLAYLTNEGAPRGMDKIIDAVRTEPYGVRIDTNKARGLLEQYVERGELMRDGSGFRPA